MTDEARITRLTEVARRVWPDLADRIPPIDQEPSHWVRVHGMRGDLVWIRHPRALDALEAALLVLAGEGKVYTNERALQALEAVADITPAWVEQLAADWEASARRLRKCVEDATDNTERITYFFRADVWERAAQELRERARRT